MDTQWHEPSRITQGDSVIFKRRLNDYPAGQGWYLLYAMRGNGQDIQFTSTADGDNHSIDFEGSELWLPAEYQLEGWAVSLMERHQIYLGSLTITPDLSTAAPDVDVRTHAQKMLASIETQLEKCAQNILLETDVEQTKIVRESRNQLLKLRQSYLQERCGEIAAERSRNSLPNQRKRKSVLSIMSPGYGGIRQFGAGSVFGNFNAQ
jgi:hypothetical protein